MRFTKDVVLKGVLAALFSFLVVMVLAWLAYTGFVSQKVEKMVANAQEDLLQTLRGSFKRMCAFVGNTIVDELGSAKAFSRAEMQRLCRLYGIGELNIADTNGVWIASSEPNVVGNRLDRSPLSAEFMKVLEPGVPLVHQTFRSSIEDPDVCRAYTAIPFRDHSGLLEVGYDQSRVPIDYARNFSGFLDDWDLVDGRYYVLVDGAGRVFDSGRKHQIGKNLTELGYTIPFESSVARSRVWRLMMDGESSYCLHWRINGMNFLTVFPESAFNDIKRLILIVSITLFLLFAGVFGFVWYTSARQRAARRALHEAEAARQHEDLLMARSIQHSALPDVFPPYPRDLMIDLFAEMIPARDVGGDFYDFFYAGRDRLAVLVADVSGKGVPAAMFMMKAKMILRARILACSDLAEAVAEANERLCEGNVADMFVTCWVGVLDEMSGVLTYVNAGHNPPYLQHGAGAKPVAQEKVSGLFLGAMSGVRYRSYTTRMSPGDLLFLYTDGVTEANNALGGMFGEPRLEEVLEGARGKGLARFARKEKSDVVPPPDVICTRVRNAVNAFAGKAAQFDDITTLALRYRGRPQKWSLSQPADLASVPALSAFAEEKLLAMGCPQEVKADILVALDEVANNVARYSGSPVMTLEVECASNPTVARLRVIDFGTPWNPLEHLDPDTTLSADERAIGGLGILMVKKLMDDVSYIRRDDRNEFAFRKAFASA